MLRAVQQRRFTFAIRSLGTIQPPSGCEIVDRRSAGMVAVERLSKEHARLRWTPSEHVHSPNTVLVPQPLQQLLLRLPERGAIVWVA